MRPCRFRRYYERSSKLGKYQAGNLEGIGGIRCREGVKRTKSVRRSRANESLVDVGTLEQAETDIIRHATAHAGSLHFAGFPFSESRAIIARGQNSRPHKSLPSRRGVFKVEDSYSDRNSHSITWERFSRRGRSLLLHTRQIYCGWK